MKCRKKVTGENDINGISRYDDWLINEQAKTVFSTDITGLGDSILSANG